MQKAFKGYTMVFFFLPIAFNFTMNHQILQKKKEDI